MSSAPTSVCGYDHPHKLSLKGFALDFIELEAELAAAEQTAEDCVERPAAITGLPEVKMATRKMRTRLQTAWS